MSLFKCYHFNKGKLNDECYYAKYSSGNTQIGCKKACANFNLSKNLGVVFQQPPPPPPIRTYFLPVEPARLRVNRGKDKTSKEIF